MKAPSQWRQMELAHKLLLERGKKDSLAVRGSPG
jgi:hypothetical protein